MCYYTVIYEGDIVDKFSLIEKYLEFNRRFSFDKEDLRRNIELGKRKLQNNNLSRKMRQNIKIDIATFERFLKDDFEYKNDGCYEYSTPSNIDKLRDFILVKMQKQYNMLGYDIIKFIIELSEMRIFEENLATSNATMLAMDEQIELLFKNYEKNSPKFLLPAKEIILDEKVHQIQIIEDEDSYCHYDSISGRSYLLINNTDAPCIFNHEVEHAIEEYFKYHTNYIYDELGAILNEMLFNEEIFKYKGYLLEGDFDFRLDEFGYLLKSISEYFKVLLFFAGKNFNVSTNEMIQAFVGSGVVSKKDIFEYLTEDIATNWVETQMGYLFSFLKALELRELFINSNTDSFYILERYLKSKKFVFRKPKDGYMLYERYIDDVKTKTRKK